MQKTRKGRTASRRPVQVAAPSDPDFDPFMNGDPSGDDKKSRSPTDPYGNLQAKYKIMTAGYRQYPRAVSRMTEIGLAAKAVLSCLMDYIQSYGDGRCFPSIETIAGEVGVSKNTARRAIKELLAKPREGRTSSRLQEAFLTRELGRNGSYEYTLTIPDWVIDKYGRLDKKSIAEKFRDKILEKCNGNCAYCGRTLEGYWEADHIVPKVRGGSEQLVNRVAACRECNEAKGKKTAAEFGYPELMPKEGVPIMGIQAGKGLPKMGSRKIPIMGPELEGTGTTSTRKESARPSVGQVQRPKPSSLLDSASKAVDLSNQVRAKKESAHRKWDKGLEVEKANWKSSIHSWRGQKFYEYMAHLCQRYGVPLADQVDLAQGTPDRYAKAMNDVLVLLKNRSIDNEHFARILERLIEGWNTGGSDILGRHGKISVYGFRYKIDEVIAIFKDPRPSSPKTDVPKSTPKEILDHLFGPKKEEEK